MNIALNTDIVTSQGSPEPYLRAISEAGFTHLHWCHQWCTDFFYGKHELKQIAAWLKEYNLKLLDIHGSNGVEKNWFSVVEYERKEGVELVLNRVQMLSELEGTGALMMHAPFFSSQTTPEVAAEIRKGHEALRRSLDELMPHLEKYGVRIAIENLAHDTFELLGGIMNDYPEKYLGITYDSGHGNIGEAQGLPRMEAWKHRLQALHLNDNDTSGDLHQPPFYGTVDWLRMVEIIKASSYQEGRPLSFELAIGHTPFAAKREGDKLVKEADLKGFLADAYQRCRKLAEMAGRF